MKDDVSEVLAGLKKRKNERKKESEAEFAASVDIFLAEIMNEKHQINE